jgi:hypothetical protein
MQREKFDPRNHEDQDEKNRREYNESKTVLSDESAEPPLFFWDEPFGEFPSILISKAAGKQMSRCGGICGGICG